MKKSHWTDYISEMEKSKSPQVPAHIWENLIPHLPQPKKNRKPLLFLLSFLLIAGVVASYYSSYYNCNPLANNNSTTNTEELKDLSKNSSLESSNSSSQSVNTDLEISNSLKAVSKSRESNKSFVTNTNISSNKSYQKYSLKNNSTKKENESSYLKVDPNLATITSTEYANESQAKLQNQLLLDIEELNDVNISLLSLSTTPQFLLTNFGDCYEFSKKRKPKWAIDIYAGPQYSPNKFKAKSNEFIYSAGLRESTESANISFLAGARVSVSISNFILKAGLEYQHIYNQLNHIIGFDTSITVRTINGQVVGVDTTYGKRTIKNHNYHHLISLPISIGYQKRLKENALQVNIGTSLNLWMQSNGAILDNRLRPLQFNSPLNIYNTTIGLSPFINVQWNGPIMHSLRYFVEPQFQFNPSFDNSSYGIKHNMNSYQIKLGLQYLFQ